MKLRYLLPLVLSTCTPTAPVFAAASVLAGCGLLTSAVPAIEDVIMVVQDGATILDAIDTIAHQFFLAHPDQVLQAKYDASMAKCRISLDAALRTARAAKEFKQGEANAAFADFRAAYTELTGLLGSSGIQPQPASIGGAHVPIPIAMTYRVPS